MANLTEAANWDAGVYRIETTDLVVGGEDGIDNKAAKNLANRTKWLKEIYVPDMTRKAVEALSGGLNTVLYDQYGAPSVMYVLPKFTCPFLSAVHPAFIVGGVEKSEIFIGKYQASVVNPSGAANVGVSLPNVAPAYGVSFNSAVTYCRNKGSGWHLMTNSEWAALIIQMTRLHEQFGFEDVPPGAGNNQRGWWYPGGAVKSRGKRIDGALPGVETSNGICRTGSGPAAWFHDGTMLGVADLCGNVSEFTAGLMIDDGLIMVAGNNNAAGDDFDFDPASGDWWGIQNTGEVVNLPDDDLLSYDYDTGTGLFFLTFGAASGLSGITDVQKRFDNVSHTGGAMTEAALQAARSLSLFPDSIITEWLTNARIRISNGTKVARRGGHGNWKDNSDVFDVTSPLTLELTASSTESMSYSGFRPCYIA